jgi:3-deoxy-manno-octulosonate cytidylyltransferase (CMP-KDO synthetase)
MNVIAVIPAHLASVRFPGKILFPFHGLPMIEHVRRRALLCESLTDVVVATCDNEIASVVESYGGTVIMTADTHSNGTTRVAEAARELDCSHVLLLQGDEPLTLPRHLELFVQAITESPESDAWNATGPIEHEDELDRHSFVKCTVSQSNRILYCFRRSPCYCDFNLQKTFIRKILGMIAFRKDFLLRLTELPASVVEQAEFIEQMRIIESGHTLRSIPVSPSLPSVNEPTESDVVLEYIERDPEQAALLERILQKG